MTLLVVACSLYLQVKVMISLIQTFFMQAIQQVISYRHKEDLIQKCLKPHASDVCPKFVCMHLVSVFIQRVFYTHYQI